MIYNIETLSQRELLRLLIHIHDKYAIDAIDATRIKDLLNQLTSIKPHDLIIQDIYSSGYTLEEVLETITSMADKKAYEHHEENIVNNGKEMESARIYNQSHIIPTQKLEINMEDYLQRADKGKTRRKYVHDGYRVGMYNLAGELEMVFDNLTDAVDNNPIGATYKGILASVKGEIKKHKGKLWRKIQV